MGFRVVQVNAFVDIHYWDHGAWSRSAKPFAKYSTLGEARKARRRAIELDPYPEVAKHMVHVVDDAWTGAMICRAARVDSPGSLVLEFKLYDSAGWTKERRQSWASDKASINQWVNSCNTMGGPPNKAFIFYEPDGPDYDGEDTSPVTVPTIKIIYACKKCQTENPWAEANQPDGTFLCYSCDPKRSCR